MCSSLSGNILRVASAGLHLSSSSSCCEYLYWVLRAEASGVCVCVCIGMSMNYYLFVSASVYVCLCHYECICSGSHGNNNNTFLIADHSNIHYDLLLYCC